MDSKTYGMFGPQGLLAKIESEEECRNNRDRQRQPKRRKKISETTVMVGISSSASASDENPIVQEPEEPCANLDQSAEDVRELSSTPNTNPSNPVILLKDRPPMEAAFSVEKIRNLIFSHLEPVDLCRCRLVSSSWLGMATNEMLLKRNKEDIRIQYSQRRKDLTCVTVRGRKRRLENLVDVLDGLGSHTFPGLVSMISKMTIAPDDLLEFFDSYGFVINSLDVTFQTPENKRKFVFQVGSLLGFVTTLITEQMPNLVMLKVKFEAKAQFAGDAGLYCAPKGSQNVRVIEFNKLTPYEIIDAVCCLAPKVEQLIVEDLGFWVKYKHRMNLLKTFDFTPSREHLDQVDAVEAIFSSEEKVDVTKLSVMLYGFVRHPELWLRVDTLVKMVFEKCCHSLKEICLKTLYFLPGTVLPQMPKVKLLLLDDSYFCDPSVRFFPEGVSLATTFPNLHTISFKWSFSFARFLSLCKHEEVASVKKIVMDECDVGIEVYQKYFPNAVVTKN